LARRYYNTSARDYNSALQTFPRNLLAESFGFHPVGFFEADESDRAVPKVQFGDTTASGPSAASGAQDGPPQPGHSGPPTG
jgi:hypothetical protein